MKYLFALDSGTTSTRATLFDLAGHKIYTAQRDLECTYPFPGYVHQDPTAIFVSAVDVINEVLIRTGVSGKDIIGLGIATQRETVYYLILILENLKQKLLFGKAMKQMML